MKAYDCVGMLRSKLDDRLHALEAAWPKARAGTGFAQQYGWPAAAAGGAAAAPPPPGPGTQPAREWAVARFKVGRCMLPYKHPLEACPDFHVLKVGAGAWGPVGQRGRRAGGVGARRGRRRPGPALLCGVDAPPHSSRDRRPAAPPPDRRRAAGV
jgi:hypothetical protein